MVDEVVTIRRCVDVLHRGGIDGAGNQRNVLPIDIERKQVVE
jgi:hypothetical protein